MLHIAFNVNHNRQSEFPVFAGDFEKKPSILPVDFKPMTLIQTI